MKKLMFVLLTLFFANAAMAQTYTLKRAVVSWENGLATDSLAGGLVVSGTMTIIGNTIDQTIKFCEADVQCEELGGVGTILHVDENMANVAIRMNDSGFTDTMTILSLHPNIITMIVFNDGTVEVDEWEPVQ